jgi:hypothetical protein
VSMHEQSVTDAERQRQLQFAQLIGKPGAVKRRYHVKPRHHWAWANDLRGTIKNILGGSGATVDFGGHKVIVPLDDLIPSDGTQKPLPA